MSLIVTLFIMLFIGIGLTITLSNNKNNIGISILLAPSIGCSVISIAGMFYINYGIKVETYHLIIAFLTSISLSFSIYWIIKNKLLSSLSSSDLKIASLYGGLFIVSLYLMNYLLNPVKDNLLFHRLASDLPSYLNSSQHLIDGGNLSNANSHIFSNEIFNRAFRWGFPAVGSFVGWLNDKRAEYVIFYVPLIFYVSGLFASFLILLKSDFKSETKRYFFCLFPIIAFNVGIIFFLFEGFYPQIISIATITILMSIFLSLRKDIFKGKTKKYLYLNTAITSASLVLMYSEAYIISILSVVGVLFLDILLKNKQHFRLDFSFLLIVLASTILIFPFVNKFVLFTIANSANIGNIGFPLPSRPLPSDWIGITNVFSNSDIYLERCGGPCEIQFGAILFQKITAIILSIWVIYEIIKFIQSRDKSDKAYFLVPLIGILSFFIVNLIFTNLLKITGNYYLYNKTITLFLPLVAYIFFSHLYKYENHVKLLAATIMCFISFVFFIEDSRTNKAEIDLKIVDYFQEHPYFIDNYLFTQNERGSRNGAVDPKLRYVDRAGEMILSSLINADFIDQWNSFHWKNISEEKQDKEIIIWANSDHLAENALNSISEDRILFKTGKYMAVSTGVKLKEINSNPQEQQYSKLEELFLR